MKMQVRNRFFKFGVGGFCFLALVTLLMPLQSMAKTCSCWANDQSDKTYEGGAPKRSYVRAGLMVAKINCSYTCQVAEEAFVSMRAQHTVQYYKWLETQTTLTCLGYVAKNCHDNIYNPGRPMCTLAPASFNPRRSKATDLKNWAKKNNCDYF